MVYEKKCVECGKIIDFGGKDPGTLPSNAIEFNDKIYCKECVKKFIEFGTGDLESRIDSIEQTLEDIKDDLGIERH